MDIDEPRTPRPLPPPNTGSGGVWCSSRLPLAQYHKCSSLPSPDRPRLSSVLLTYLKFPWDDLVHEIVV
ncbi:hypothetical protein GQ55_2G078500 [Panicum hallii var. hallii]|uniref:Uncharacterized protein n=1 Tax=Panicum hallii var. hallii TaxID=1504633 RepID=A0A2T7EMM2_9POAL|nr:hypothetical protein GQ55_2G078500 [Panicum hallii var. hallii]